MKKNQSKKKVSRRKFLKTSGAIGTGALLGVPVPFQDKNKKIPLVKLGKTGVEVPKLGFGAAFRFNTRLVDLALKLGVTYLDTAQSYVRGNSEKVMGDALRKAKARDKVFLVTKCTNHNPRRFTSALNGSLDRLQTDHVDLYFLHNLGDPGRLDNEMKRTAEKLKRDKKIKFFGFSSHHRNMVATMEKAAKLDWIDVIMFKYNFRDYGNLALNTAIDACAKANIGLIAMKTQGGAHSFQDKVDPFTKKGFNRFQACLKAVWEDKRIHGIVSAMNNTTRLKENVEAAVNDKLSFTERELLKEYARATDNLYCRGCGDICESCTKGDVNIADTLRYRMYHESYGLQDQARELYSLLPKKERKIRGVDFKAAEKACPFNLPIGEMMRDARKRLA